MAKGLVTVPTREADRRRDALLGALGMVPYVGGPGRALVGHLWGSAFNRRVSTFIDLLCVKVCELELAVEDLQRRLQSGDVASVGILAAEAAGRSADDEKIDRLAQGVANVLAEEDRWDGLVDHAQTMIRLLDTLTSTQFVLLEFLDDPRAWLDATGETPDFQTVADGRLPFKQLISIPLPRLAEQPEVASAAISGLESNGLLSIVGAVDMNEASLSSVAEALDRRSSIIGRELVQFSRGASQPG